MIIDTRGAEYVMAVAAAAAGLRAGHLINICPECGGQQGRLDNDNHLVVAVADPHPGEVAVVIGCEGFWVVDPKLVGIDSPNWQDWRENAAQRWHEIEVENDEDHEQHSSCWCCCVSCDPDSQGPRPNPYWAVAQAAMKAAR